MLIMDVNGIYPLDGASAIEKENRRNYGGDNIQVPEQREHRVHSEQKY